MASIKTPYELRSILLALESYIITTGWTGIVFRDDWQTDNTITNPQVTVTFLPSSFNELQLGRGEQKLLSRRVQVDAYMESERRAQAVVDIIMDFFDTECVTIVDPDGATLGYTQCPNSERILGEVMAPVLGSPKLVRWRGIVRAPMESFYPEP